MTIYLFHKQENVRSDFAFWKMRSNFYFKTSQKVDPGKRIRYLKIMIKKKFPQ